MLHLRYESWAQVKRCLWTGPATRACKLARSWLADLRARYCCCLRWWWWYCCLPCLVAQGQGCQICCLRHAPRNLQQGGVSTLQVDSCRVQQSVEQCYHYLAGAGDTRLCWGVLGHLEHAVQVVRDSCRNCWVQADFDGVQL